MRRPRLSRRIAAAIRVVLVAAGIAQVLVAALVIREKTIEIRGQLVADGLRALRMAADAGRLDAAGLAAELGDLPGYVVVTYDADGQVLGRSRSDVPVPAVDFAAVLASPDAPIYVDESALVPWAGHGGVLATPRAGAVRAVGVFDRASSARLAGGLLEGLAGGWLASFVVAQIATYLLARRILQGVRRAEAVVHRMASGELAVRLPSYGDDEIGRLADDFNAMAEKLAGTVERLEKEQEARRRRFADFTHELATPLSSVIGYLESLTMPGFDEPTRARYVATAHAQALAMKALNEDLTMLSQIELEGLALDRGAVDLAEVARAEVEAAAHSAGERVLRVEASGDTTLDGDGRRLAQVLRNLLTNAVRHTRAGGHVSVRIAGGEDLVLEVEDDGEGIVPEHVAHLGELLYRPDRARDRRTGGRGLGLAIARGVVQAHRGRLEIASTLGRGTTVRVALPRGG